jgi:D-3-phosphoglycerate dehydrogenase
MRAVFLDCTDDLQRVMQSSDLLIPSGLEVLHGDPGPDDVARACARAEVILVEHTAIPNEVLRASPGLRAVIFMGTGAGTYVDLPVAESLGIRVLTTPGYGDRAVAEHAFALMFAAARDIARMDRDIRSDLWVPRGGMQLAGRKVAVVGLGGIGMTFARMAEGVGMEVSGWNRTVRDAPFFERDLDAALRGADVVSIHLSLNAETEGLLDKRRLSLPKKGYLLVNTARSQIVSEDALMEALDSGQMGHAALDVFDDEPLPPQHALKKLASVTLTAHAAYMTDDAYVELWKRTVAALESVRRS